MTFYTTLCSKPCAHGMKIIQNDRDD